MTIEWRITEDGLRPFAKGVKQPIAWAPQPGSQDAYLRCPVTEVLYHGNRGPGKSESLLMSFAQFVGRGFGSDWRGIIFRRNENEHRDAIARTRKLFANMFPNAEFNSVSKEWRFPTGESLVFKYMEREDDYWHYHGHQYTFIGWDELTNWRDSIAYRAMFSTLRSANVHVPRFVRATCNPYGIGHSWVKQRFALPHTGMTGPIICTAGEPDRVAIRGRLEENRVLLHADPGYMDALRASAATPARLQAWLEGSWDIVAGGMFDDVWFPEYHALPAFPFESIPYGWRLDRAYDDGLSAPFSVGWYAESNGEPVEYNGRTYGAVPGDTIRIAEWYGWTGEPNTGLRLSSRDIARGIKERESRWGIGHRVKIGPADGAIYNASPRDPSASIASDMEAEGVYWERADKSPGSRHNGWAAIRQMLKDAIPDDQGRRERPGFFALDTCAQFLRTFPVAPCSKADPDDIDTKSEDHICDELRYRIKRPRVVDVPQSYLNY